MESGVLHCSNEHGSEEGPVLRLLTAILGPLWTSMLIWGRVVFERSMKTQKT